MLKMSILGAGGFGCAIASIYAKCGFNITLWSYKHQEAQSIQNNKENKLLLPGICISHNINITSKINDVFDSNIILIVVPSFAVKSTLELLKNNIPKSTLIICLSKGLEYSSSKLFSDIIEETLPNNDYAILSGPSHAEEIAKNVITAMVVASKKPDISEYIQENFCTSTIRLYINNDIIGVQIGAALKNIIALAIGICDGMKLGDNTKALLMTKGLYEISLLGVALGGNKETFFGLSGVGDLIVTCTSLHSRNKRAGILIGQGLDVQEAIKKVGMTVEGYICSKCAYDINLKYKIDLPIINGIYEILYKNKNVKTTINHMLTNSPKYEYES